MKWILIKRKHLIHIARNFTHQIGLLLFFSRFLLFRDPIMLDYYYWNVHSADIYMCVCVLTQQTPHPISYHRKQLV